LRHCSLKSSASIAIRVTVLFHIPCATVKVLALRCKTSCRSVHTRRYQRSVGGCYHILKFRARSVHYPEDEGKKFLRNVSTYIPIETLLYSRLNETPSAPFLKPRSHTVLSHSFCCGLLALALSVRTLRNVTNYEEKIEDFVGISGTD